MPAISIPFPAERRKAKSDGRPEVKSLGLLSLANLLGDKTKSDIHQGAVELGLSEARRQDNLTEFPCQPPSESAGRAYASFG